MCLSETTNTTLLLWLSETPSARIFQHFDTFEHAYKPQFRQCGLYERQLNYIPGDKYPFTHIPFSRTNILRSFRNPFPRRVST